MDLNQIINYKRPEISYYDILGCSQSSDSDQINKEYKIRALQYHPDKNSDPGSKEIFMHLQAAKDVLSDKASRKLYDTWLNSGINVPFEQFRNRRSHTFHWATPGQKGRLSLQTQEIPAQGSTNNSKNDAPKMTSQSSVLEKFRKYEI